MDSACDKIPKNCDKILFAEDVVYNLMADMTSELYEPSIATPYREFIYEAFTDDIRVATIAIHDRVYQYERVNGIRHSNPTRRRLKKYAKRLQKEYFDERFDPKLFLHYCVHIMLRAARLADSIGIQEAGDFAVGLILEAMGDWDMFHGGWRVLDIVAKKYSKIVRKLRRESPIVMNELFSSDDGHSASEEEGENLLQNANENRREVEEVGELNREESSPDNSNDNRDFTVKGKDETGVNLNSWFTAHKEESKDVQGVFEGSGMLPTEDARVEIPGLDQACTSSEKMSNEMETAKVPHSCLPASSDHIPPDTLLFLNFINSIPIPVPDKNPSPLRQRTSSEREHKRLEKPESRQT